MRVLLRILLASVMILAPAQPARAATPIAVTYDGRISRDQVMLRAADWLRRDVAYSQNNSAAAWDLNRGRRYRPDCSGFVSMVWALDPYRPGRGRALTTWELPVVAARISWAQLFRGDILLRLVPADHSREHVMLFQGWLDAAKTRAWIIEQNGHVYDMRRTVVTVATIGRSYQPYRYRRIF